MSGVFTGRRVPADTIRVQQWTVFSTRDVLRFHKEDNFGNRVSWEPASNEVSAEAEESPLLESVTKERLVKTQQDGKDLACAVVICKVWRLAMAL
jgi:hypothetical protein